MGKVLILVGFLLVIIGALLHFTTFNFHWFGRLPGDIRVENQNYSVFIPLTSMLLISVVGSFILWIIRRF